MKYAFTAIIALVALMFVAAPAMADWQPEYDATGNIINHKMHYPQMPDLERGLNVWASPTVLPIIGTDGGTQLIPVQKVLADDFLCTQTGFIRDVHIWGSWLGDNLPQGFTDPFVADPANVKFRLSLHKDIPKGDPTAPDYSRPGQLLAEKWFQPGQFRARYWTTSPEDFFDPNVNQIVGHDFGVYQYNFSLDEADRWWQDRGTTYWLDVTAFPGPPVVDPDPNAPPRPDPVWGWKTSWNPWNDDAVYWDVFQDGTHTFPQELFDPRTIPGQGPQSLNMAFVITPEPGTVAMLVGAGLIGLVAYARRRRKP